MFKNNLGDIGSRLAPKIAIVSAIAEKIIPHLQPSLREQERSRLATKPKQEQRSQDKTKRLRYNQTKTGFTQRNFASY